MKKLLMTAVIACTAVSGFATAEEQTSVAKTSHGFMLGVGNASFTETSAVDNYIDDSALSIRLGYEYRTGDYLFGAGFSGFIYDDSASFSQTVIDQYGNISTADSSSDAINLYIEGGYEYPLNEYFYAGFLGGYEQVLSSSRAISNCSDCASSDINIDAGFYINPRLTVILDSFYFSLGYQHYLNGDVENNIMLSVGMGAKQH